MTAPCEHCTHDEPRTEREAVFNAEIEPNVRMLMDLCAALGIPLVASFDLSGPGFEGYGCTVLGKDAPRPFQFVAEMLSGSAAVVVAPVGRAQRPARAVLAELVKPAKAALARLKSIEWWDDPEHERVIGNLEAAVEAAQAALDGNAPRTESEVQR